MPVDADANVIHLHGDFGHPVNVEWFVRQCKRLVDQQGYEDVSIRIRDVGSCFPNVEVPIAAVVDHYKQRGVNFLIDEDRWSPIHFAFEPFSLDDPDVPVGVDPISRIWRFTEHSATPIADAISRSLLERLALEEGVFRAINWCLYEIMDNVLQHAESEVGFVEAKYIRRRSASRSASLMPGLGSSSRSGTLAIARTPSPTRSLSRCRRGSHAIPRLGPETVFGASTKLSRRMTACSPFTRAAEPSVCRELKPAIRMTREVGGSRTRAGVPWSTSSCPWTGQSMFRTL